MKYSRRSGKRSAWALACVMATGLAAAIPVLPAPLGPTPAVAQPIASASRTTADEWARAVWSAASTGSQSRLDLLLSQPPELQPIGLSDSIATLETNLVSRETLRAADLGEASEELDEHLAAASDPDKSDIEREIALSESLVTAVRMHLLSVNRDGFLAEQRTQDLIAKAAQAARRAEARGDWLIANELFVRLNALLEHERTYRPDAERLARRLDILRLFVPERLWELRNAREIAEGRDPLPAYNPFGDSYQTKLAGISEDAVITALRRSAQEHVEHVSAIDLAQGGLDGVATLASTKDIARVFPGVASERDLNRFLSSIDEMRSRLTARNARVDFNRLVGDVLDSNDRTIGLPHAAILHELGNGATARLDEFTQIIWPDELAQFQKATQGRFIGIGVQIEQDERSRVRVVTPLEGTPAQRSGVHAGDVITAVDGRSIVGLSLNQAVSVITGEAGTVVNLTVEREQNGEITEIEIPVPRARIDLASVKGWERTGARDDDWNWFIDEAAGIGYVRLTGFVDTTDREFDRAIEQMRRRHDLNGLIVDLRFNPGGLLNQAVSIANRFIPGRGPIVQTADAQGRIASQERASERRASVTDIPVIILVNEGSASASEIVAGAVQAYAHQGAIDAIVLGQRSFGKGSVQNVYYLPGQQAAMRLTTHYYLLPNGRRVHRLPGATDWGVEPDLTVEMLPSQIQEAANLRRNADVLPINERGEIVDTGEPRPDPNDLLSNGLDLQLQYALVLLQSRSEAPALGQVPRAPMEPVTIEN
ncbi:MAG: S41 family peptidase [Phycisphaerales bacterium]